MDYFLQHSSTPRKKSHFPLTQAQPHPVALTYSPVNATNALPAFVRILALLRVILRILQLDFGWILAGN